MLDFVRISTRIKGGATEVYPQFVINNASSDLMIRGGDFYAIWVEERGLWSTNEQDVIRLVDNELDMKKEELRKQGVEHPVMRYMWDAGSGSIDAWHKYCQKQSRDNYNMLDEELIFANTEVTKSHYASKRLPYPLDDGDCPAFKKLISTLYSEEERHKIEWAIGCIVSGDSKYIQKFMVLYGAAGTGKSTILNIIQQLFDGYYSVFDAKALGSSSNQFALEAFRKNPLVAIQHDGDLSKIEDNTRLNSLVSHELMIVNEKFTKGYENRFKAFLFMGTNKPVKITDAKSGLIRRLIDVTPSGNKLNPREYNTIMKQITFELGAIANYCLGVYQENPGHYDNYIPMSMMEASNDFYNFIIESYSVFFNEDSTTRKAAWEMYKNYCEEARVPFPLSQRSFTEELKNYFKEYYERYTLDDGTRVRNYYKRFDVGKFESTAERKPVEIKPKLMQFDCTESIFDSIRADCPAQYASAYNTPKVGWDICKTKLSNLDTSRLHYVKVPENHIVIDFDIPDENGNKCLEKNLEEASKWPPTYAELSKSGQGIHLHYIYDGDPTKLSRIYDDKIEIKVFTGGSSLRRKLTKCNDIPIATISSGLPLKGEDTVVNFEGVLNEKGIRTMIKRNLNKESHPGTKPSIDFIFKILEDAYKGGAKYDVSDMYDAVLSFAAHSTNNAEYCLKVVDKMHFKSDEPSVNVESDGILVFYDVEVFPNLFLVNFKAEGEGKKVVRLINPKPAEIESLLRFRLIGFNNREYDNHMIYACLMGYTNYQLYELSKKLISKDKQISRAAKFGEAFNLSYTDVYDFASAANKKSLKKFEIELGIHHQELGLPWDEPVPEERWEEVAEYCDNDVIATEAVFHHLKADWTARQILADLTGLTVNDTTNTLSTKFLFGNDRNPQRLFNYRNLAEPVLDLDPETYEFLNEVAPEMMAEPHGNAKSVLPYFPGYTFEGGKSIYRDEEIGEGGRVYAEPGMYTNVALLDVASMHPHSMIMEVVFGNKYTKVLYELVYGRVYIKHEDWERVNNVLDGKLTKYVQMVINGEMTSTDLANALKTVINSLYGLTAAAFMNLCRDPRNKDNIVAKRGALFMTDLKYEVQKRGFTVAHIKTDSIKIPNATPEIIQFVMDFGKRYGYTFEHEATYDRMCLVNNAVYIARYKDGKHAGEWTATGAQFAVPYVFKTLFSREPIEFEDLCETKSVTSALYLKGENTEDDPDFVGRVGLFCPIKPGCGGSELLRISKDAAGNVKYDSATGAKGYFWLEAEAVKNLGKEADIDKSYYDKLVNDAVAEISKYGDFEWFISDDSEDKEPIDIPPWEAPEDPWHDNNAFNVR
jgi:hypothetical protein